MDKGIKKAVLLTAVLIVSFVLLVESANACTGNKFIEGIFIPARVIAQTSEETALIPDLCVPFDFFSQFRRDVLNHAFLHGFKDFMGVCIHDFTSQEEKKGKEKDSGEKTESESGSGFADLFFRVSAPAQDKGTFVIHRSASNELEVNGCIEAVLTKYIKVVDFRSVAVYGEDTFHMTNFFRFFKCAIQQRFGEGFRTQKHRNGKLREVHQIGGCCTNFRAESLHVLIQIIMDSGNQVKNPAQIQYADLDQRADTLRMFHFKQGADLFLSEWFRDGKSSIALFGIDDGFGFGFGTHGLSLLCPETKKAFEFGAETPSRRQHPLRFSSKAKFPDIFCFMVDSQNQDIKKPILTPSRSANPLIDTAIAISVAMEFKISPAEKMSSEKLKIIGFFRIKEGLNG